MKNAHTATTNLKDEWKDIQVIEDIEWNTPYKRSAYIEHTQLIYRNYLICIFPLKFPHNSKHYGYRIWDQDGEIVDEEVNKRFDEKNRPTVLACLEKAKQTIRYLLSIK